MRSLVDEYIDIVIYTFCGVILVLGSYNIIINVNHAKAIDQKIMVRDVDANFKEYKDNVTKIENEVSKIEDKNIAYNFNELLSLMKNDGAYRLFPKGYLSYMDLYNLNNYFIDKIINDGWTQGIKEYARQNEHINLVKSLINNYEYINKELLNNSNYSFNIGSIDLRDQMKEEYDGILSNYCLFSRLVLDILDSVGESNA